MRKLRSADPDPLGDFQASQQAQCGYGHSEILDQEVEMAVKPKESEISRTNYDFVFLRQENLGAGDEYVLGIIPKRNEKYLFRGQVWVDASTFRIRRLEGVPAKSPSFWIKSIHITMQFADLSGMWLPISFDAIAAVRFSGHYTIAGLNMQSLPSAAIWLKKE